MNYIISLAALACAASAAAESPIKALFAAPQLDRWMYPFDASPGNRPTGSTFGSTGGEPEFDNRDGQITVAFDTQAQIPAAMGRSKYTIMSAYVELEVANDQGFVYDNTQDSWTGFVSASHPSYVPDNDPGQPVELFATGFRNGWTAATFYESAPYCPGTVNPMDPGVRNMFAAGVNPDGTTFDVSNNVREEFDPVPLAYGTIEGATPGEFVAQGSAMRFEINVADPGVQAYFQGALDSGMLHLTVTSLTRVEVMGGQFPSFIMKEHALVPFELVKPPSLYVQVSIGSPCGFADLDCSGTVDGADLGILLGQWNYPGSADFDNSGVVDGADLGTLLGAWG